MKEITIVIPCWGRYDIFNLVAKQLTKVRSIVTKYKINVVACISVEDLERVWLSSICRENDINVFMFSNNQLGAKHNQLIKKAFELYPQTDYIMNLGSDDLIHESLFELYNGYINNNIEYFGIDTCYFYNYFTKETIRLRYNLKPNVIGAGRMLHRSIFNKVQNIYTDTCNSALDSNSSNHIINAGFKRQRINVDDFPYIVDIKASTNINSFQSLMRVAPEKCTVVEPDVIIKKYGLELNKKIIVDSCNMEFGYELISAIPYAYYLHKNNLLKGTISAKGSSALYYFSPNHKINKEQRSYSNVKKANQSGLPNTFIHRHILDTTQFETPDYKKQYANNIYKYDKPIVCICNRYNIEWGKPPINYFSVDCLDNLFTLLKEHYQIIYFAVDIPKELQDGVAPLELNDRKLIDDKHNEVIIFQDILKKKDWNFTMLQIFANTEHFITMNGGYSILASYFGGQNIIYSKPGLTQTNEINIGSFQRWYPNFNNSQIKYIDSYTSLLSNVKTLYIDKLPTVNILIRTCQRPNFFKSCIDSIESQDYKNINIIIGKEKSDTETLKYLIKYKHRLVTYDTIKDEPKRPKISNDYGVYFPFNHYLDEMNKTVDNGWIMYLDDDDMLLNPNAISNIVSNITSDNDVIFWRCEFGNKTIPSDLNYGKRPVCCDVSGIGFIFHSKFVKQIEWGYWKRGDFRVANKLYKIGNAKFINEVLTGIQTEPHAGKIVDKKEQLVNGKPMSNHVVMCESLHRKFGVVGSEHPMEKHLAEILQRQGYVKIIQ